MHIKIRASYNKFKVFVILNGDVLFMKMSPAFSYL